jgi:hypothetical protein
MYELRCTMYDGKAKDKERRFYKMIMISTDHDHHDHLRSLSKIVHRTSNIVH